MSEIRSRRPLRILVIGAQPPPIGGATISLRQLVRGLERRQDVSVTAVNTTEYGGRHGGAFSMLRLACRILAEATRTDVVTVHASVSRKGLPVLGSLAYAAARLTGRPFLLRKFGGAHYDRLEGLRAVIARFLVRHCDLYLPQTQALVERARQDGVRRIEWYPGGRPVDTQRHGGAPAGPCRRFVFLGQIRPTKGIEELAAAAEHLPPEVEVDLYGPLLAPYSEDAGLPWKRLTYCGVLRSEQVPETLARYHALVLPTYFEGEGYPGVIFEAFNAGLPVVATRWMSLPEIVDERCGLLVEPRDANSLYGALRRLVADEALYACLCAGARRQPERFSSQRWEGRFVELARALGKGRAPEPLEPLETSEEDDPTG